MKDKHLESDSMQKNVQIAVVTHKKFPHALPQGYDRIQVGCALSGEAWDGYIHDNSGDHISEKNGSYCELTALYWLWKNSDADIKGLCHYRRFFCDSLIPHCNYFYWSSGKWLNREVMKASTMRKLLKNHDVIVAVAYFPYPRTAREDLLKYVYEQDVAILDSVIQEHFPDYWEAYNAVMALQNLSYHNMLIAGKKIYGDYCSWLFSVLKLCEERCNIEDYDVQHKRIYGYLAEVLLNVYLRKHEMNRAEVRYVFVEEYYPSEPKRSFASNHIKEKIIRISNHILGTWLMESLFRKFKPRTYVLYEQYIKSRDR